MMQNINNRKSCPDFVSFGLLTRKQRGNKGVALILVVTLIVIFFLLATTFVSMSTSFYRSSKKASRQDRVVLPSRRVLLDDALMMLVRDVKPGVGRHPLRTQAILTDLYGLNPDRNFPAVGGVIPVNPVGGFQFVANSVEVLNSGNAGHNYQGMVYGVTVRLGDQSAIVQNQWQSFTRNIFNGRYLTFIDGSAKNQTVSIVNFRHTTAIPDAVTGTGSPLTVNSTIQFWVLTDKNSRLWQLAAAGNGFPAGSRFVVNARPYTGAALSQASLAGIRTKSWDDVNFVVMNEPFDAGLDIDPGHHNMPNTEPTDLFMATNLPAGISNGSGGTTTERIVPSFHRFFELGSQVRDRIREQLLSGDPTLPTVNKGVTHNDMINKLRRVSPIHHPNFTGSNPAATFRTNYNSSFDPIPFDIERPAHRNHLANYMMANQPNTADPSFLLNLPSNSLLDVDNDGDGVPDSFWMDIGLPEFTTAQGKRVKPLVAILVEDQGGKVNINTAVGRSRYVSAGGRNIPVGQGYGPAEIRVQEILKNNSLSTVDDLLLMKYGIDSKPGIANRNSQMYGRQYGNLYDGVNADGQTEVDNLNIGLYGTPADFSGQFVFAPNGQVINTIGFPKAASEVRLVATTGPPALPANARTILPFTKTFDGTVARQFVDNPYTFDVFGNRSDSYSIQLNATNFNVPTTTYASEFDPNRDRKFDVSFLELMNRIYDRDFSANAEGYIKQLGQFERNPNSGIYNQFLNRLAANSSLKDLSAGEKIGAADRFRRQLTTESYHVPSIPFDVASMLRHVIKVNNPSRASLFKNAFFDNGSTGFGSIEKELLDSLGPEIIAGLPFNLNPVFGNGLDDGPTGDGVPDGYSLNGSSLNNGIDLNTIESLHSQKQRGTADPVSGVVRKDNGPDLDIDNDGLTGSADGNEALARHVYARRLYTLALLLVSKNHHMSTAELAAAVTPASQNERRLRVTLAQWAANVVDFQDADSINTAFEFDLNPFDGWDVDGNLETDDPYPNGTNPTESFNRERGIVFGVERPELLLTEAVGFHDHASKDEYVPPATPGGPGTVTHKQSHVPYGPAFIELFNPNLSLRNNFSQTGEMVSPVPGSPEVHGVQLNKTNTAGDPVFRMLVVNGDQNANDDSRGRNADREISMFDATFRDPVFPGSTSSNFDQNDIESAIYFASPATLNQRVRDLITADSTLETRYPMQMRRPRQQFFHRTSGSDPGFYVTPGNTAVVGSAGPHANTFGRSIFGRVPINPPAPYPNAPATGDGDPFVLTDAQSAVAGNRVNVYAHHGRPMIRLEAGHPVEIGRVFVNGTNIEMNSDADFQFDAIPFSVSVPLNAQFINDGTVLQEKAGYSVFSLTMPVPSIGNTFPDGYPAYDPSVTPASGLATDERVEELDGYRYRTPKTNLFTDTISDEPNGYGNLDSNVRKSVVLQRLANPTLRFHPIANPYVSVDHIRMSFNGYGGRHARPATAPIHTIRNLVQSSQRGNFSEATGGVPGTPPTRTNIATKNQRRNNKNVWLRSLMGQWRTQDASAAWFQRSFTDTTGRIGEANATYSNVPGAFPSSAFFTEGEFTAGDTTNDPAGADVTALSAVSQANSYFLSGGLGGGRIHTVGDPFAYYEFGSEPANFGSSIGELNRAYRSQFAATPWLRIANRPLVNAIELAEVPCQSNALLLEHITFPRQFGNTFNPYERDLFFNGPVGANDYQLNRNGSEIAFQNATDRIPHYLLNFFADPGSSSSVNANSIARLVEFASTQDLYVGSYRYLPPQVFSGDQNGLFNHPYNWFNNRRIPGRINVNRVFHPETYYAMMGGENSAYVQVLPFDGRSQFDTTYSQLYGLDNLNSVPNFSGMFNSQSVYHPTYDPYGNGIIENKWVHDDILDTPNRRMPKILSASETIQSGSTSFYDPANLEDYDLSTTWFRSKNRPGVQHEPAFDYRTNPVNIGGVQVANPFYDTETNPYFKNLMRQRLAKTTTNKSSVFNIWVTVGYFEMEETEVKVPDFTASPAASFVETVPPFGTTTRSTIGKELGLDTGEVRRDRAFYVFDRSIPMGFSPGMNLNVQNGILFRRVFDDN